MHDREQGELPGIWIHADIFIQIDRDLTVKRKKRKNIRVNTEIKGVKTNNNSRNRKYPTSSTINKGSAMQLTLEGISKKAGAQSWLYDMNIAPRSGAVTVLLGATQAGKTSLMRIMAGLDVPTSGRVLVDGKNVVGVPVRERNVAMVYQQFINYPSLRVFDNIASPLKLRGEKNIDQRVRELAEKLHIEMFLDRYPAELSGGQQQRVALARALAKGAPLMLLDEPLVNLDYKLREELRDELSALFAVGDSTVIYATTEPGEALLLGGYTAVLDAGELLQYGPTAEVFHKPKSLRVARAFSDPPMNLLAANVVADGVQLDGGPMLPLGLPSSASRKLTLGLRASALKVHHSEGDVSLPGKVELAEISGSDTFVHVATPVGELVAQLTGVHYFELGAGVTLYFNAAQAYVFDAAGLLLLSPVRGGGR
jgi:glycerol transport system ATP-binding protein